MASFTCFSDFIWHRSLPIDEGRNGCNMFQDVYRVDARHAQIVRFQS